MIRAFAPGRVNLIGDHTDYTGGLVLPCAIDLGTTVTLDPGGTTLELRSVTEPDAATISLPVDEPSAISPDWARYAASVAKEMHTRNGGRGTVETTLPIGAGLSSSAAFELAVALALGFEGSVTQLALLCQRAEQRAVGVPCGVMDQLSSAAGVDGHCLLIDCTTLEVTPVRMPDGVRIVVVDSREPRALNSSAYAERRAACERAAAQIGPLRTASLDDLGGVTDSTDRRRARHVITENDRVQRAAAALSASDVAATGQAMNASHASLRDDFEVSSARLDVLVDALRAERGVYGARLTGAGFGGCCVALVDEDATERVTSRLDGLVVRASAGARVIAAG